MIPGDMGRQTRAVGPVLSWKLLVFSAQWSSQAGDLEGPLSLLPGLWRNMGLRAPMNMFLTTSTRLLIGKKEITMFVIYFTTIII